MFTTHRRRAAIVAMASTAAAVVSLVLAHPAAASSGDYIAAPNGMTGATETITIKAPDQKGKKVSIKAQIGSWSYTYHTTVNSHGYGSLLWTPEASGSWKISGLNALSGISTTVKVSSVPSYTVLLAPNNAQVGVPANVIAGVVVPIGTSKATGTVSLADSAGGTTLYAPLDGTYEYSNDMPYGTMSWTPVAAGNSTLTADFGPDLYMGGMSATKSPGTIVSVGTDPLVLSIRSMANSGFGFYVGSAALLQAALAPGVPDGTVSWTVDGQPLLSPQATTAGTQTINWLPDAAGAHTVTATYSGTAADGVTPVTAMSTLLVTVQTSRPVDGITVGPKGSNPWSPSKNVSMKESSKITLAGSSTSGTPVILSETGPCVIQGAVLRATNTGTCKVTATSPGNLQYSQGTATYTVAIKS